MMPRPAWHVRIRAAVTTRYRMLARASVPAEERISPRLRARRGLTSDSVVSAILVTCAVGMTGFVAYREVKGPPTAAPAQAITEVEDWARFADGGHRIGPSSSPVTITVFSDYQCPWCKRLDETLVTLRAKYPREVAVVYRHFPLDAIHPVAREAALVAECAATQGRFEQVHAALFQHAELLLDRPWASLASDAGVPDTAALRNCIERQDGNVRVRTDVALGDELEVQATPTVLVNQFRIAGTPTLLQLDSLVGVILRSE
jgi:protein-disulfide isomerase